MPPSRLFNSQIRYLPSNDFRLAASNCHIVSEGCGYKVRHNSFFSIREIDDIKRVIDAPCHSLRLVSNSIELDLNRLIELHVLANQLQPTSRRLRSNVLFWPCYGYDKNRSTLPLVYCPTLD